MALLVTHIHTHTHTHTHIHREREIFCVGLKLGATEWRLKAKYMSV